MTPEPTLAPRFPFNQLNRVGVQIADQLSRSHAVALVCSAACGADLIALETAQKMGLARASFFRFRPLVFAKLPSWIVRAPSFGEQCLIGSQALLARMATSSQQPVANAVHQSLVVIT